MNIVSQFIITPSEVKEMAQNMLRLVYGVRFPTLVSMEFLDILDANGVRELDTGASYPGSEEIIGKGHLSARYRVHTKTKGYAKGTMGYKGVLTSLSESRDKLWPYEITTYYLETPDLDTPIIETLSAIHKDYQSGGFEKFGLSNFLPSQVQEVYDICQANNYVFPTIYQGNYNPIGRHAETALLPLLRKLKIRFTAYGVLAGGFLTKSPDFFTQEASTTSMRWNPESELGKRYHHLYNKPSHIQALERWEKIAEKYKIEKAALALRWVAFNSALKKELGDGMILGALTTEHLTSALGYLKDGPLEKEVVDEIEEVWEIVKEEAIFDNFNGVIGK